MDDGNKTSSRRAWTKIEEEILLNILDAVVADGSRSDNGTFKSGIYKRIENELAQLLPDSGLKVSPHIDSKIRIWKQHYSIIFDMLNTSGFGWNDVRKCVEVDSEEVWNSYVQSHKDASSWRDNPFLYYDRLGNIFEKDRATGKGAETPADMADTTNQEQIHVANNETVDVDSPMSVSQPSVSQTSRRKRSRLEDRLTTSIENMVSIYQQTHNDTIQSISEIAQRLFENQSDDDGVRIAEELTAMELPMHDEFQALNLILEKPSNIKAFMLIQSGRERKLAYVRWLLGQNH